MFTAPYELVLYIKRITIIFLLPPNLTMFIVFSKLQGGSNMTGTICV